MSSTQNEDSARPNRRALLAAGGASSIAALTLRAGPAQAQQTRSDAGPSSAAEEATKAAASWAGSLALQAATCGAPIVAMYNLRATLCFGPKAKAPPGRIWNFEDIATPTLAAESGSFHPT